MNTMSPDRSPRLMKAPAVREYLGDISPTTLWRLIKRGLVPPPLDGTQLWDRRQIDERLDRGGRMPANLSPEAELERRAERWDS